MLRTAILIGLMTLLPPAFGHADTAAGLSLRLSADPANPATPRMGDRLAFHTVIGNAAKVSADGIIAWISLVQVDPGSERPVDLEDWSAQKAITIASLAPGETTATDWPIRLIQPGHYRVLVSAASRSGETLAASPFADFTVGTRPVVESRRVLPVALGIPLLLVGMIGVRRRR